MGMPPIYAFILFSFDEINAAGYVQRSFVHKGFFASDCIIFECYGAINFNLNNFI